MVDAPHTNKNKATVLVIARVCVLCMSEFEAPKKNRHQARYLFDVNECMLRGICMHRAVLYARCATYSATYSAQHVARHVPRSMLRDMFRATCTYSAQHALVNFEKIYPDTARIARNMLMNAKGQYRGAGHHSVHVHGSFNSVRCAQYTRHRNNLIVLHIAHNMQVCTWRVMCPDRSPQRKVRTVAARASLGAGTVPDARRRTPMCLVTKSGR
jgi:hypothetical protein